MDTILINGTVYTMDPATPKAQALAIRGEIIEAVGSNEEILKLKTDNTEVIDLAGQMVLPGLIDAHCHPSTTAFFMNSLFFTEEMTLEEVLQKLKDYVKENPDRENYFGVGYNEIIFQGQPYSTEPLDQISSDKPIFLASSGMHSGWVNAATFKAAGIDKTTPDPLPGFRFFGRDDKGELNGHVVETVNMIYSAINFFDLSTVEDSFAEQVEEYNAVGVTSLVGGGSFYWQGDASYTIPMKLIKEDRFNVRLFDSAFVESREEKDLAMETIERFGPMLNTDRIRLNTFKVIMDGIFEAGSASMMEKYVPDYEIVHPLFEGEEIETIFLAAAEHGYDIHSHGIGDYAIHEALRGAKAVRDAGYDDTRITIAHCQYVAKEDRPKFGELDVIVNTTGSWHYWYPGIEEELGFVAEDEFTIREIIDGGAVMTMGSDRPADEFGFDPRANIVGGMTRRNIEELDDPAWKPLPPEGQELSLQECLEAHTVNAAHQVHMDGKIGQLIPGAYADIAVFARDMFNLEPEEILDDPVTMTIFNGGIVYQNG